MRSGLQGLLASPSPFRLGSQERSAIDIERRYEIARQQVRAFGRISKKLSFKEELQKEINDWLRDIK